MIIAAVAALILVVFNHSGKSHTGAGTQPSASDVGRQSTPSTSVTSSTPAAVPATTPPAVPATSSPAKATTPPAKAATRATKAPTAPAKTSGGSAPAKKPVTYVVKHGDNLTVIADWFHQHGYGRLYELNRSVIGTNPNLIFPGEKITISHGSMTLH